MHRSLAGDRPSLVLESIAARDPLGFGPQKLNSARSGRGADDQKTPRLNESPGKPGIQVFATDPSEDGSGSSLTWVSLNGKLPRKEVIQPQVPLRLPCYDFTPITTQTLGRSLLAVGSRTSGSSSFRGVTGGVYKARERIHRGMLIRDY